MIQLKKFLDSEGLSDFEKKFYNENSVSIEIAFNDHLDKLIIEKDNKTLEVIIRTYQLFTYDDDNKIGKYVRDNIYNFYIKNIDDFITDRNDWIIYMLVDLFYCDSLLFPKETNNDFLEKSYPILLLSSEGLSSFIAIASMRLISIIGGEGNLYYLQKYLIDKPDGDYIDEVKEEIENLN